MLSARRLNGLCAALIIGAMGCLATGAFALSALILVAVAAVWLTPFLGSGNAQRNTVGHTLSLLFVLMPLTEFLNADSTNLLLCSPLIWACLAPSAARITRSALAALFWTLVAWTEIMVAAALSWDSGSLPAGGPERLVLLFCLLTAPTWTFGGFALRPGRHSATPALEPTDTAQRDFLATVSHELRTPLNAVIGGIDLLRVGPLSAKQQELARQVATSSRLLLHLIGDLLDITAWESGQFSLESEPVDLMKVLTNVRNAMAPQATAKGLQLHAISSSPVLPRVQSDRRRLEQLVYNLVGNAIKYTQRGHVNIRMNTTDLPKERLAVRIEVEDTGPGIPKADLERIFERFFRSAPASKTTTSPTGAGIGLSVVQHLVAQLQGTITVHSEVGEGTSFIVDIELPLATEIDTSAHSFDDSAALRSEPWVALVVDDGALNLVITSGMLTHLGGTVLTASSIAEAEAALTTLQPDIVLMDFHLPDGNGIEATARLRESGLQCPVIGLSASSLVELQVELANTGWSLALVKPLTLGSLREALREQLCERLTDGPEARTP